jgi:UPF0176 protein
MQGETSICNLAFYKFVPIGNPAEMRCGLYEKCLDLGLKGTILVAEEGINGMIAGPVVAAEKFAERLTLDPRFTDLVFKRTYSKKTPFKRLLVKVKKEIVTFRQLGIDVPRDKAPYVKPAEFRKWLESDNEMILIDTRNDFEVQMGTFKGAVNPGIPSFAKFPQFVQEKLQDLRGKKIVTFCTGGIRCEKATAYLAKEGFENVYQLEGGILEYLNQTSGEHFEGKCFVFDDRITL